MKILIFNWRCWLNPAMGGAEVFTHEVAKRWVKLGHEVTLFTSEFPDCRREEVLDGARVVRAGGRFGVYRKAKQYYGKRFSKESYDIVVDEINTRPFFAPKFVKAGEKVVALIHQLAREYWFYETPFPVSYLGYHFLEDRWLRNYVDVPTVTVSESTKQDLLSLGFKRISVVSEGLNFSPLSQLAQKEEHPVIVFAGRLERAKRPDHAVKAFRIVKEKVPDAELWVLGDGSFRRSLERMSGDGVRFLGHIDDAGRRERIARSWVLVNPSVREGWGLNVIEANALGVPCVAYEVPGLRDSVVACVTGLLVENGNVDALGRTLIRVIKDEGLRQELSMNSLEYARGFDWDISAKMLMKSLERISCKCEY